MANLSWTNSGRLEEKIHNYTIIYCHPCSNCTTTGRVDGINGNASTYKLHLPVNNTCYEIKMISCTLSSCRMYSDSITHDIKAGLAIRHGNSSGETTTSNDQSIRYVQKVYIYIWITIDCPRWSKIVHMLNIHKDAEFTKTIIHGHVSPIVYRIEQSWTKGDAQAIANKHKGRG